jgi:hypothetical protein
MNMKYSELKSFLDVHGFVQFSEVKVLGNTLQLYWRLQKAKLLIYIIEKDIHNNVINMFKQTEFETSKELFDSIKYDISRYDK